MATRAARDDSDAAPIHAVDPAAGQCGQDRQRCGRLSRVSVPIAANAAVAVSAPPAGGVGPAADSAPLIVRAGREPIAGSDTRAAADLDAPSRSR